MKTYDFSKISKNQLHRNISLDVRHTVGVLISGRITQQAILDKIWEERQERERESKLSTLRKLDVTTIRMINMNGRSVNASETLRLILHHMDVSLNLKFGSQCRFKVYDKIEYPTSNHVWHLKNSILTPMRKNTTSL